MITSIRYLERALRSGKSPTDLGATFIGSGVQKTAYLIMDRWVIKADTGGYGPNNSRRPPRWIRDHAKPVMQWKAGKWIIQEFVRPLREFNHDHPARIAYERLYDYCYPLGPYGPRKADLHQNNVGVNKLGELVVFDW